MQVTFELPDALAEQIRTAAAAEGQDFNNYAVARLQEVFNEAPDESEGDDPEIIAITQKAMDAYDRGERGRPVEEVWAEMDAKYGPVKSAAAAAQ